MTSSPSPSADLLGASEGGAALVACGAIAAPAADVIARREWAITVHPLPPLLHNRPDRIAAEVERLGESLEARGLQVIVGYADCGTYGALDEVCARRGWARLPGLHCYDVYAGADSLRERLEREPGTYLLTDFLVRSFARTVERELGLDRYPELRDDYFGHYTKVVWLAQSADPVELAELRGLAQECAARLGLPLEVVRTGDSGLERALADLVAN